MNNSKYPILKVRDPADSFHIKVNDLFDTPFKLLLSSKSQHGMGKTSLIVNFLANPKFPYRKMFKGENIYIISNNELDNKLDMLSKEKGLPKSDHKPIWENKKSIGQIATDYLSLKRTHQELSKYRGWGGGGFMSYEVVTDLNYTPVLEKAKDRMTWANAGPGAVRGLNRIHDRKLEKALNQDQCNVEMKELLTFGKENSYIKKVVLKNVPKEHIDMRTIEHSLCEWDKYERVRLGQGRPRSKYVAENTLFPTKPFKRGAVD